MSTLNKATLAGRVDMITDYLALIIKPLIIVDRNNFLWFSSAMPANRQCYIQYILILLNCTLYDSSLTKTQRMKLFRQGTIQKDMRP